ncbi:DeoR/GlpR family DNA-binding transcription regulator [Chloroflexus aggregans]|uniref:Transcriptional regulator, DeoR family n=1 Tax=Chloroflexus aggregans (strain MD-66 / DSM 9485) TaxID=326427 RepID=B8G622_CHLAD|nr:DeoR/GlpR family DNA-binding transcription regulator [Chloroflexus aggregans]ACL25755.1 transcriptional regulator, DeoR family [Chloroflexus aggregans DSM 9485]
MPSDDPITGDRSPLMLDRRSRIAELVRQRGSVRVNELAEFFGVTPVTIRNDLAALEREGVLIRDHGGAVALPTTSALIAFEQRTGLRLEAKARIGAAAAQFVNPGDTILLDAGTTVVEMVKHLRQRTPLTVVTNALNVVIELRHLNDVQVWMLGGMVHYATFGTLGPLVEQSLGHLVVEKLFLAAESVDASYGVTDSTSEIAQTKRALARAARRIILLADSSKWQRRGFIKVLPFESIETVITDTDLPEIDLRRMEEAGVRVMLV